MRVRYIALRPCNGGLRYILQRQCNGESVGPRKVNTRRRLRTLQHETVERYTPKARALQQPPPIGGCNARSPCHGGNMSEYPNAKTVLERSEECWLWIVPECPLCGGKHQHGGGVLEGDPYELLGHRAAHCAMNPIPEPGGYDLTAEDAA